MTGQILRPRIAGSKQPV